VQRDGATRPSLTEDEARAMLGDGSAGAGMRPKLRAALTAARAGCEVRILDGRDAEAISAALRGEPAGTRILAATGATR
jgi:acetylglutamate kinase